VWQWAKCGVKVWGGWLGFNGAFNTNYDISRMYVCRYITVQVIVPNYNPNRRCKTCLYHLHV